MKTIISFLLFTVIFGLVFYITNPVFAIDPRGDGWGLETATDTSGVLNKGEGANASDSIAKLSGKVLGAGLAFLGTIFLLLIIYGGIMWMTAQGNETQVEKAQKLIVAAVIGLIIVLSAYAISSYLGANI